jgi:hypothetical protein
MQDGFAHAVGVLRTFVFALAHVYVLYDFAPASLNVEFGEFFPFLVFASYIFSSSFVFLLFLARVELFELETALLFAFEFFLVLSLLNRITGTLFSRRRI